MAKWYSKEKTITLLQRFGILICTMSLAACASGQDISTTEPSWQDKIEERAKTELTREGLPSLQIAIGLRGEIIYDNAFGFADIESRKRALGNTQYRIASISKWLTGTATFKLVDAGRLDIDAPIQTYCPEYPEKDYTITTRHLLSHTSGIRHYADYGAMRAAAGSPEQKDRVEAWIAKNERADATRYTDTTAPLEVFKDDPLQFKPGSNFQYSSFGYRVLGCVISGASDASYRETLARDLFRPLGMTQTEPEDSNDIPDTRASLYAIDENKQRAKVGMRDISANLPAGGHLSTAGDLIRFTTAFSRGEVLSEDSIAIMTSQPTTPSGEEANTGYGHGVDFMGDFPGSIGHGGRQEGTTTLLLYLPDYDVSIAVLTNVSGWRGITPFTADILNIVRDHGSEL